MQNSIQRTPETHESSEKREKGEGARVADQIELNRSRVDLGQFKPSPDSQNINPMLAKRNDLKRRNTGEKTPDLSGKSHLKNVKAHSHQSGQLGPTPGPSSQVPNSKHNAPNKKKGKPQICSFKFFVYYYYMSFNISNKIFVLSEIEFNIFLSVLRSSKLHQDDIFRHQITFYLERDIIKAGAEAPSQEEPSSPFVTSPRNPKSYTIASKGLRAIKNDFLNGRMRLGLSCLNLLKMFAQFLSPGQPLYEPLYQSLQMEAPLRLRVCRLIQEKIKLSHLKLKNNSINPDKSEGVEGLPGAPGSHGNPPQGLVYQVAVGELMKVPIFANKFNKFLFFLRFPDKNKNSKIYHFLGLKIKSKIDKFLEMSKNLSQIPELNAQDFQNNLLGLFNCGFIGEILSFTQIQESSEVILKKWFN